MHNVFLKKGIAYGQVLSVDGMWKFLKHDNFVGVCVCVFIVFHSDHPPHLSKKHIKADAVHPKPKCTTLLGHSAPPLRMACGGWGGRLLCAFAVACPPTPVQGVQARQAETWENQRYCPGRLPLDEESSSVAFLPTTVSCRGKPSSEGIGFRRGVRGVPEALPLP